MFLPRTVALELIVLNICIATSVQSRPNVILIVADDLGWGDVSFHGSKQVKTPNIDSLASAGITLNNYYVSPICSPSRSALLSGMHPIHTGMQHDVLNGAEPFGFPLSYQVLPQYLKKLGYATHAVGKWHLGMCRKEMFPTERGFDSHFGYLTGHGDHYDHSSLEDKWGMDLRRGFDRVAHKYAGNYSTEMYTQEALAIIEKHNRSQPLFLYLAYQAVHAGNLYAPLQVPQMYESRFSSIADPNRRRFVAMVSALDDALGHIVQGLAEHSMLNDSLIVFTTDNGAATGGAMGRIDGSYGSNWPLRGVKFTLWEGGIRGVAFLWSYLLDRTALTYNGLTHVSDWLPTIYEAVGGPSTDLPKNLYGKSFWSDLTSPENATRPRKTLLHNIDDIWGVFAIRSGDYKLIGGSFQDGKFDGWFLPPGEEVTSNENCSKDTTSNSLVSQALGFYAGTNPDFPIVLNCSEKAGTDCDAAAGEICLFNVASDPCETNNIAASHPAIVRDLLEQLSTLKATAVKPGNKPPDSRANPVYHGFYWDAWLE